MITLRNGRKYTYVEKNVSNEAEITEYETMISSNFIKILCCFIIFGGKTKPSLKFNNKEVIRTLVSMTYCIIFL